MRLALILVAYLAVVVLGGCTEDQVNSVYEISISDLQVTTNVENGEKLLQNYLFDKDYLGSVEVSGKSRAENDKEAVSIYEERIKAISRLDLTKELALKEGEELTASFTCTLKRHDDLLKETRVEMK